MLWFERKKNGFDQKNHQKSFSRGCELSWFRTENDENPSFENHVTCWDFDTFFWKNVVFFYKIMFSDVDQMLGECVENRRFPSKSQYWNSPQISRMRVKISRFFVEKSFFEKINIPEISKNHTKICKKFFFRFCVSHYQSCMNHFFSLFWRKNNISSKNDVRQVSSKHWKIYGKFFFPCFCFTFSVVYESFFSWFWQKNNISSKNDVRQVSSKH